MRDDASAKKAALQAGTRIVQGISALAGMIVALTAACAAFGFFYFFGYLSTIGTPWAKDLITVNMMIVYGAPMLSGLASATLLALLIQGRSQRLPRIRYIVAGWFVAMSGASVALVLTEWTFVVFLMQVLTGLAAAVVVPAYLIRTARAWRSHEIGLIALLINVVALGSLVPLAFGIAIGVLHRTKPAHLGVVELSASGENPGSWRIVLSSSDWILITKESRGEAFRQFKLVSPSQIDTISATSAGAPWAPDADAK